MKKKKEIKRKKGDPTGKMEIICFAGVKPDKQSCEFVLLFRPSLHHLPPLLVYIILTGAQ